jgi:periplasmic copper chaperone A
MFRFHAPALAVLLFTSASSIALADDGVISAGCPTGQSFALGDLTVSGAFVRATAKGAPVAGAYLSIANAGSAPDTLTGATSLAAGSVALHQMSMSGNVMKMSPLEGGLVIPAGGSASLDPMGSHLMLTGPTQPLVEGGCVEMVLHFAHAGDLPIELNIGGLGQKSAPATQNGVSVMLSGAMDMSSMSMGM